MRRIQEDLTESGWPSCFSERKLYHVHTIFIGKIVLAFFDYERTVESGGGIDVVRQSEIFSENYAGFVVEVAHFIGLHFLNIFFVDTESHASAFRIYIDEPVNGSLGKCGTAGDGTEPESGTVLALSANGQGRADHNAGHGRLDDRQYSCKGQYYSAFHDTDVKRLSDVLAPFWEQSPLSQVMMARASRVSGAGNNHPCGYSRDLCDRLFSAFRFWFTLSQFALSDIFVGVTPPILYFELQDVFIAFHSYDVRMTFPFHGFELFQYTTFVFLVNRNIIY